MALLQVNHLTKNFGGLQAVSDVSFSLEKGEILGLIGPNGAGKTTAFNLITGFIDATRGEILFEGKNIIGLAPHKIVKRGIARTFQIVKPFLNLSVLENVVLAAFLKNPVRSKATREAKSILEFVNLTEKLDSYASDLTLGQQKKLEIARCLATKPKILFLDEPTTGLDPRGRQDMWGVIEELVKDGVTLLLTTQYLEEADQLADEIAVIDHGRVIARGSSDDLKRQVGGERLEIVVEQSHISTTARIVEKISGSKVAIDEGLRRISAPVSTGATALIEALRAFDSEGIHPLDIGLKRPSLDDVFLALTGHVAEEEKPAEPEVRGRKRGKK